METTTAPIDEPQPGIEIAVTDASGHRVKGVTERDGSFVLAATSKLKGGRYFVVAEIPAALSDLTPVPESSTFQPLSTTVDVTSENQTVRMGVAAGRTSTETPQPEPTSVSRSLDRPEVARFAVGDVVWRDDNRSGVQDAGESPASRDQRPTAQRRRRGSRLNGEQPIGTLRLRQPSGRHVLGAVRRRARGVPADAGRRR